HARSSFFIQCLLPFRDLHSFPTRRSSDLGDGIAAVIEGPVLHKDDAGLERQIELLADHAGDVPVGELIPRADIIGFVDQALVDEDRKSTRLNSSHVAISYAVFCLKKKKMN